MSRFWRTLAAAVGLAALTLTLALPGIALAHEQRTIAGGKYQVVVGWDVEPAFQAQKNAASIRISKAGTDPAQPIEGAEKTLKVQIRQGSQTREFPLRTVFRQPGYYVADLVPMAAGDFQWTFVGTIGDDAINEKFDTADGKFNAVGPIAALQFPAALGDPAQTAAALREAQAAAQAARAAAQNAETLAYVGIGVGALGLLAAVAAWATRRRGEASAATPGEGRA